MRRAAVAAVLLVLPACSSDASGPTTTTFARSVAEPGTTFTVPGALTFRSDGFTSSVEAADGYYANFPLGDGCTPAGCGGVRRPPANGVVVSFGVLSGMGTGVAPEVAPNTSIAGRDAVVTKELPGDCGGDETITAWIPTPNGSNVPIVRACLSGPDLATGERIVQEALDTAVAT